MYIRASEIASVLPDNDFRYFIMLEGVINSIDSNSSVHILRKPSSYTIRLSPSDRSYIDAIIKEILVLHNLLGLSIDLSKSIKTSGKIFYEISSM